MAQPFCIKSLFGAVHKSDAILKNNLKKLREYFPLVFGIQFSMIFIRYYEKLAILNFSTGKLAEFL